MAADLDNLGGVIGEVLGEVRDFTDPWGMPGFKVTGEVLRGDHPDWRQHELDIAASQPEYVQRQELVNERLLNPLAPKGFRQTKKLSETQAHQRLVEKTAKLDTKLKTQVFNLRDRKPGLAAILCKSLQINGETVVTRAGKTHDLSTAAGRESLLDHQTWQFEQEGEIVEATIPVFKLGPDGAKELDDFGEPVRNECAGWNIGDALAWLIENEADDTEKFVKKRKAALLEPSVGTATGTTASGSQSQSPSDES